MSDIEADDAKDSVPLSSSPPAAHFPNETEITNPVPKKNVTVKKTAAKVSLPPPLPVPKKGCP